MFDFGLEDCGVRLVYKCEFPEARTGGVGVTLKNVYNDRFFAPVNVEFSQRPGPPPGRSHSDEIMDEAAHEIVDTKALYRSIDRLLDSVVKAHAVEEMVNRMMELFVEEPAIPILGARVWERRGDRYVLFFQRVEQEKVPVGFEISADEPSLTYLKSRGVVFLTPEDPEYDHRLEESLGVSNFAAVTAGLAERYIVSFDVVWTEFSDREEFMLFLDIVRQVINSRLSAEHYEGMLREARTIQTSALPQTMPDFEGYDVYGLSIPAEGEQVGGDLFGWMKESGEDILTLFIGDASGHGLPAALMARDLHTALHMGNISDVKLTRMVSRINRIFCENTPPGKYMTLFYGEIDALDQLVYCSAGHPGLVISGDDVIELKQGGPILGVKIDARYRRGVHSLRSGDLLCLYTDGLSETFGPKGEMFGDVRIHELLRERRGRPSQEIVEEILDIVHRFGGQRQEDDRTLVVAQRK